jgi:branched-chain amino acid transport system substrate-binding protein
MPHRQKGDVLKQFSFARFATLASILSGVLVLGSLSAVSAGASANKSPITIGYMCTCSGPTASSNTVAPPAYQAWVDMTNAHGGINGHKIKLIVEDDQASPTVGLTEATKLVTQDHVIAIVDWSLVDGQWGPYVAKQHIPVVGADPNGTPVLTSPDFFATGTTNIGGVYATLEGAKKSGGKLGIFYCAESPQCSEQIPTDKQMAPSYGVTVNYTTAIGYAEPNYTAECLAAKAAGVTVLTVADATQIVEHVAQSCDAQGYDPTVLAGDGAVAKQFVSLPLLKDKMFGYEPDMPFFVTNVPGTKAMLSAFRTYQPSLVSSPNYGETAVQSWVSGLLFAAAAKAGHLGQSGAATSKELLTGLYALHKDTLGGMTPPLTYKRGAPTPINCWYWIATKNGKFTTPTGLKPVCHNA